MRPFIRQHHALVVRTRRCLTFFSTWKRSHSENRLLPPPKAMGVRGQGRANASSIDGHMGADIQVQGLCYIISCHYQRQRGCTDRVGPHGRGPAAAGATATTVQVASATSRRLMMRLKIQAIKIPAWSISPALQKSPRLEAMDKKESF